MNEENEEFYLLDWIYRIMATDFNFNSSKTIGYERKYGFWNYMVNLAVDICFKNESYLFVCDEQNSRI